MGLLTHAGWIKLMATAVKKRPRNALCQTGSVLSIRCKPEIARIISKPIVMRDGEPNHINQTPCRVSVPGRDCPALLINLSGFANNGGNTNAETSAADASTRYNNLKSLVLLRTISNRNPSKMKGDTINGPVTGCSQMVIAAQIQ